MRNVRFRILKVQNSKIPIFRDVADSVLGSVLGRSCDPGRDAPPAPYFRLFLGLASHFGDVLGQKKGQPPTGDVNAASMRY